MKRLRIAAAIAATALALVPLALAVTCSYTRYRSEYPCHSIPTRLLLLLR